MTRRSLSTLMQDGAKGHTSRFSTEHIRRNFQNYWSDWPGNSPDLNVIEHIWEIIQNSVFEEPRPTNREELITRAQKKWNSLDESYLKTLIESFPNRIRECLEANGGSTHY